MLMAAEVSPSSQDDLSSSPSRNPPIDQYSQWALLTMQQARPLNWHMLNDQDHAAP